MIVNVPTWEDLETISLQLYFNAWAEVSDIVVEFRDIYEGEPDGWEKEWGVYIDASQTDLQAVYTLTQQSQEIGVKALIARVSPFLLLKRHETKPVDLKSNKYDFSDFPTVDAGELIRVHNVFCENKLSDVFSERFEEIRRARNKIAHLGLFNQKLDPEEIVDLLLLQYRELYPTRSWLPDRVLFASKHRWADYNDDDYWSPEGKVMYDLWKVLPELSKEQSSVIFGRSHTDERVICPDCGSKLNRFTDGHEPYQDYVPTAFKPGEPTIQCALCGKEHEVKKQTCTEKECNGDLTSADPKWRGMCLACGLEPGDMTDAE